MVEYTCSLDPNTVNSELRRSLVDFALFVNPSAR